MAPMTRAGTKLERAASHYGGGYVPITQNRYPLGGCPRLSSEPLAGELAKILPFNGRRRPNIFSHLSAVYGKVEVLEVIRSSAAVSTKFSNAQRQI